MGLTIGKGFQGSIKRWKMKRGLLSHGSKSHRKPGSIGMRYSGGGGRVFSGRKLAGRVGNNLSLLLGLSVIKSVPKYNSCLITGALPGKQGNRLIIRSSRN